MPNLFSLIGSAWNFYKTHGVLRSITFWMLTLPLGILFITGYFLEMHPVADKLDKDLPLTSQEIGLLIGMTAIEIVLSILLIWGVCSVLLVGKRMLKSNAGRSKSSFKLVRKEARRFIVPLLLSDILRDLITLVIGLIGLIPALILLSVFGSSPAALVHKESFDHLIDVLVPLGVLLLFLVPAIAYSVQTTFYSVLTVCEDMPYRKGFKASRAITRGRTLRTLLYLVGLSCVLLFPAYIFAGFLGYATMDTHWVAGIVGSFVGAYVLSVCICVLILTIVDLYKHMKDLPRLTTKFPLP